MAVVDLDAGHVSLRKISGLRYGVVIELAFGREKHVLLPLGAEPAAVGVGGSEHAELLLAAFGGVGSLGAWRAADYRNGGLDRVHILADGLGVEIATSPRLCPGSFGVAMDLGQVISSNAAEKVTGPLFTANKALG